MISKASLEAPWKWKKEEETALDKIYLPAGELQNWVFQLRLQVQDFFVAPGEKIFCSRDARHELNCDDGQCLEVYWPGLNSWVTEPLRSQMRSSPRVARRHGLSNFAPCAEQNDLAFSLCHKQNMVGLELV